MHTCTRRLSSSFLSSAVGRCLAIALLMIAALSGASAVDLAGKSFAITLMAPGGEQKDHLSFTATDLTSKTTGKISYTASAKKKSKAITFEATTTDANGGTLVISGEVDGQDVHGSITQTPKGGQAVAINFSSAKTKK